MAEPHRAVGTVCHQGRAHVPMPATVEMSLQGEAEYLPAPALGLSLKLGEARVGRSRSGQEALQVEERLERRRRAPTAAHDEKYDTSR